MPSGFLGGGIGPVALKRRRAAAADWWPVAGQTCVAAYQPIGAASLAASYVNLANPGTYDAAPGVAPTLAAGGWVRGAALAYLRTGIIPVAGWSYAVRYSGANTANDYIFGTLTSGATATVLIRPNCDPGQAWNGGFLSHGVEAAAATICIAGQAVYLDGAPLPGVIPSWAGVSTKEIFLLAWNNNGTPPALAGQWIIAAVAIYSTTLSAADVAALTTRMQALA